MHLMRFLKKQISNDHFICSHLFSIIIPENIWVRYWTNHLFFIFFPQESHPLFPGPGGSARGQLRADRGSAARRGAEWFGGGGPRRGGRRATGKAKTKGWKTKKPQENPDEPEKTMSSFVKNPCCKLEKKILGIGQGDFCSFWFLWHFLDCFCWGKEMKKLKPPSRAWMSQYFKHR